MWKATQVNSAVTCSVSLLSLLGLTFLEGIFCHELHCLPKPVRSVGVLCLLSQQAARFDECHIVNRISVNPFHCSWECWFLKVSFEIVMGRYCCFKHFFQWRHAQAWKESSWKLFVTDQWLDPLLMPMSIRSCSISMERQQDKCSGSLRQTWFWHWICKLALQNKKEQNELCELLAIYFEGAEWPACALQSPLVLQWTIPVPTSSTELGKNPWPAVMPRPGVLNAYWMYTLQLWKDYREQRRHRVEDLSLQIRPCVVYLAARTDAVSSGHCPLFLSLARTPTQCFQACLTAPAVWNDTYS